MTRQDYIHHLDMLRKGVLKLMDYDRQQKDLNGPLVGATDIEQDRAEKTQKMFENLSIRLYEDAGVSEKVKNDKLLAGDMEQAELTFTAKDAERVVERAKRKGGAK